MIKRFFAFGCSYTQYSYATWADFVGCNFDEYYNYGRGGASNSFIMNRVVECDEIFKFNSETDTVIVMLSGFGRFSYLNKKWFTDGDLYSYYNNTKDSKIKGFLEHMWSEESAIYNSWIAAKTIKTVLKDIPHKLFMAIDNRNYFEMDGSKWGREQTIRPHAIEKTKSIYSMLDDAESLDEWMSRKYVRDDYYIWKEEGNRFDGHPTQKMHFDFIKDKIPEYLTAKSQNLFNQVEEMFIDTTQHKQGTNYFFGMHGKLNNNHNAVSLFGDNL
jgi:hypothetical protein